MALKKQAVGKRASIRNQYQQLQPLSLFYHQRQYLQQIQYKRQQGLYRINLKE